MFFGDLLRLSPVLVLEMGVEAWWVFLAVSHIMPSLTDV